MKAYLLIRLRGRMGISPETADTLNRLNIPAKNNATIIADSPSIMGMVTKIADYVTWGEVDRETLAAILEKRGRLPGDARLKAEDLKQLGFEGFDALAERIIKEGKIPEPIKKTFRLTPPSGGFKKHITRHIKSGGELGYRGPAINELAAKMI